MIQQQQCHADDHINADAHCEQCSAHKKEIGARHYNREQAALLSQAINKCFSFPFTVYDDKIQFSIVVRLHFCDSGDAVGQSSEPYAAQLS